MLADIDEQGQGSASTRLLAAASEEFARHGFASARIRNIADAARVNQAAANYYFGGKEGLYRATLKHLAGRLEPLDAEGLASGCPSGDRLHRCVVAMLNRFASSERALPLARILAHESVSPTKQLDAIFEDALAAETALLRSIVRETVTTEIDAEEASSAAHAILWQCVLYLHARSSIARSGPTFGIDPEACEILASQITQLAKSSFKRMPYTPGSQK